MMMSSVCLCFPEMRTSIILFLQSFTQLHFLGLVLLCWPSVHFAFQPSSFSVMVTLTYCRFLLPPPPTAASTVARHSASSPWVRSSSQFATAPRGTSSLWWCTPAGEEQHRCRLFISSKLFQTDFHYISSLHIFILLRPWLDAVLKFIASDYSA